jgi:hypothetical protein
MAISVASVLMPQLKLRFSAKFAGSAAIAAS